MHLHVLYSVLSQTLGVSTATPEDIIIILYDTNLKGASSPMDHVAPILLLEFCG